MKRLNMTKEAAFKDEAEQSSHLSDSGKENNFFFHGVENCGSTEIRTYNSRARNRQKWM